MVSLQPSVLWVMISLPQEGDASPDRTAPETGRRGMIFSKSRSVRTAIADQVFLGRLQWQPPDVGSILLVRVGQMYYNS